MLAESDSYNRVISVQQLKQSYQIFKMLLSTEVTKSYLEHHVTDEQILNQPNASNPLHKVVTLDCHRTRSANFTQQQKKSLESVLNYFVRLHQIQYKQGLNEIAALFVLWTRIGVPLSECYKMFERFFIKFSLNFYYDKDFTGLEMFFRMISLVLRYHSPSLSRYLAVYDIEPQIYALSWLMTLFSSKLSMKMTYLLWQYLIAENDKYLLFFIVVGIIVHKKNEIIQTKNSSIFKIVTDMIFKTQSELQEVIKISLILRKNTPISLTAFFQEKQLFDRLQSYKQSAQLLEHITKLNVLVILPKQLYSSRSHNPKNCHKSSCLLCIHSRTINVNQQMIKNPWLYKFVEISNDVKKIGKRIQFVIIDLRKQKTRLNSVSQVHQVDINQPFEQIENSFLNEYLEQMSSKHFTILLTGFTFEDTTFSDKEQFACAKKFLNVLNSYSFPSLGILQGGYTALSIYEQEYRVKYKTQEEEMSQDNQANHVMNGLNSHILQNVLLQGKHQMSMPLSLLFQIAQLKYNGRVRLFNGSERLIILVLQCFLIVLQDKQGLVPFISYLQHNCSIVPYFYSSFNNISCRVLKVLPVEKIIKLKGVTYSENTLVVKYFSEMQEENQRRRTIEIRLQSQKSNSGELSTFLIDQFKQLLAVRYGDIINSSLTRNTQKEQQNKKDNIRTGKQKKLLITMKDIQQVKQISSAIQGSYKSIMKHKYKTQKQQQQSL